MGTFKLLRGIKLSKPSKSLHGPAKQSHNVLGQFTGTLSHKEKLSSQIIYVIRDLKTNLLGLPAITSLGFICRLHEMTYDSQTILAKFPSLFKGLGTLGDAYTIKMTEDAVPYSLCTPRNVAIPLREKVRIELNQIEANGRVTEHLGVQGWLSFPKERVQYEYV